MKRDIKSLFKNPDLLKKKLPALHREEFIEKLNAVKSKDSKKLSTYSIVKVAAFIILFFSIGYTFFNEFSKKNINEIAIEVQLKVVEQEFLKNINQEWDSFLAIAEDKMLIKRYEEKLKSLDNDYKETSLKFKNNTNNVLLIESLVENLQNRLQLLTDIQQHIKILNNKSQKNESIII